MTISKDDLPIIIGVGQAVDRWDGLDAATAPHPVEMIRTAIGRALKDTASDRTAAAVDCAVFIRTFPDSLRKPATPFGKIANLPRAVLKDSGLDPRRAIYSAVGGDQPQAMVNEMAAELASGKCKVALIAGGEVIGALKAAIRNGHRLDWADDTDGPVEDRGYGVTLLSPYEIANGLGMPPQVYAAQEQAWRARKGLSTRQWRESASLLFSRFSEIAASNPYAQFPRALDAEFLATPSQANYPICDPLLKWHVAQDAVNLSAALVLTTVGTARKLGVPEERWVYLHGHADVKDGLVSQRPDLSHSDAIRLVLEQALSTSRLGAADIAHLDFYSCFPIVPMLAAEYLGIDPLSRDLTVTGGLPFFGGPGNSYSTHAIASMVEKLRADRGSYGLVLANGGFISKESAGVYSARQPEDWAATDSGPAQQVIADRPAITILEQDCDAEVEAFTVIHGRNGPEGGYVIGRNPHGRVIARIDLADSETTPILAEAENLVGRRVKITHRDGVNYVTGFA